ARRRRSAAIAAPRMRRARASAAPAGPRGPEVRAGGEALRYRRRARIERRAGARAPSAAQAAGGGGHRRDPYRQGRRLPADRRRRMIGFSPASLQFRLAARLAVLSVGATAIAAAVLIYQAYDTAASLNDRELSQRADDLARAVVRDGDGAAQLPLPQKLASAYATSGGDDIFAVRDRAGRVLAASPAEFGERVAKWPPPTDDPAYFHLTDLGTTDYYGLSVELAAAAGPVSVSVARAAGANALVHSLLREFVSDIAWVGPMFMAATLAIGFFAIRSGLKPVEEVSRMAAAI